MDFLFVAQYMAAAAFLTVALMHSLLGRRIPIVTPLRLASAALIC
jgi:hypothetical protein